MDAINHTKSLSKKIFLLTITLEEEEFTDGNKTHGFYFGPEPQKTQF